MLHGDMIARMAYREMQYWAAFHRIQADPKPTPANGHTVEQTPEQQFAYLDALSHGQR